MIRRETKPGTELREHGEKMREQTRDLAHVVTEFLKFARPLDLADEQVTLRPLIDRILTEVSEVVPDVPVTCEGEFGDVSGDDALLRQAILNLARNAAEAAAENPGGGRVIIRGAIEQSGAMQCQRISVSDNGQGIPAHALNKLFMPSNPTNTNRTARAPPLYHNTTHHH